MNELAQALEPALPLCRNIIQQWCCTSERKVTGKPGRAGRTVPVTAADISVQRILTAAVAATWPTMPILAEEENSISPGGVPADCVIIDPIDGTTPLLAASPYFAVAICRLHAGKPIEAVVDLPAFGVRLTATPTQLEVHGQHWLLPTFPIGSVLVSPNQYSTAATYVRRTVPGALPCPLPTATLKIVLVALGHAEAAVYLPLPGGGADPWDFAAAALVLAAAGGQTRSDTGVDLSVSIPGPICGWHAHTAHPTSTLDLWM